jgi:hypothetical protein
MSTLDWSGVTASRAGQQRTERERERERERRSDVNACQAKLLRSGCAYEDSRARRQLLEDLVKRDEQQRVCEREREGGREREREREQTLVAQVCAA